MLIAIVKHALAITAFVLVMMLTVEYLNVLTRGHWQKRLFNQGWKKYVVAALLGVIPGCLGAFMVVAMFSHGMISLGALVTTMIATSGDETFVMLAMIPKTALLLTVILFVVAVMAGVVIDKLMSRYQFKAAQQCTTMAIHEPDSCHCFPRGQLIQQLRACSPLRGVLAIILMLVTLALIFNQLGPQQWNYIKVTFLIVHMIALFIILTVPDHFLEEHLWQHVAKKHVWKIFLWTLGALLIMHGLQHHMDVQHQLLAGKWIIFAIACLVGLIPESGPHLIFVTLFAEGSIPFSVLLASSIVQDGHGMLPLLSFSRTTFILVKVINLLVGFSLGAVLMSSGF